MVNNNYSYFVYSGAGRYDARKRQLGPHTRLGTGWERKHPETLPKRFPAVSLAVSGYLRSFQSVSYGF